MVSQARADTDIPAAWGYSKGSRIQSQPRARQPTWRSVVSVTGSDRYAIERERAGRKALPKVLKATQTTTWESNGTPCYEVSFPT